MPFSKKLFATCMTPEEYCRIPTSGDRSISLAASSRQSTGTRVSESTTILSISFLPRLSIDSSETWIFDSLRRM